MANIDFQCTVYIYTQNVFLTKRFHMSEMAKFLETPEYTWYADDDTEF